jgi:hypothetical protein
MFILQKETAEVKQGQTSLQGLTDPTTNTQSKRQNNLGKMAIT